MSFVPSAAEVAALLKQSMAAEAARAAGQRGPVVPAAPAPLASLPPASDAAHLAGTCSSVPQERGAL